MDRFPYDKYCPSVNGSTEKADLRVNLAQFGDGYRQAAPDGINADIGTVEVAWNNIGADAKNEIQSFLQSRLKHAPFLFKMPDWPSARIVYCTAMSKPHLHHGMWSINATLQRAAYLGSLT